MLNSHGAVAAVAEAPHLAVAIGVGEPDELIDLLLGVEELLQEDLRVGGVSSLASWRRKAKGRCAVLVTVSSSILQATSPFISIV